MTTKKPNLGQFFLNQGIIVLEPQYVPDFMYELPFSVYFQPLLSDESISQAAVMKLCPHIPRDTTHIATFGYMIPFGERLAKTCNKKFLSLESNKNTGGLKGFQSKRPLEDINITLVGGRLVSGMTLRYNLELIKSAGGICNDVYYIIDYNLNILAQSVTRDVKIHSAVNMKEFIENIDSHFLLKWEKDHKGWFRSQRKH